MQLVLPSEIGKPKLVRIGPYALGDCLHSGVKMFGQNAPSAESGGIQRARHVAYAMHSAWERQDSAMQPSGDQVTRLKTFLSKAATLLTWLSMSRSLTP